MQEEKVLENVASLNNTLSTKMQTIVFAGLGFLALIVPFGFGHPQWLVGTIVNTCLFLGALFLPKKYWLTLIVFPSLGVLARGLIFGPLTFFIVYFLPFIWIGNWILMLVFEKFFVIPAKAGIQSNTQKPWIPNQVGNDMVRYLFVVLLASVAKFLFLFLAANLYFNLKVVPKIFVASMGLNQLATAFAGGIISILIYKAFKNYKIKNI